MQGKKSKKIEKEMNKPAYKTITRYSISHIPEGSPNRILSVPNQGRCHKDSREEAQTHLDGIRANGHPEVLNQIYGENGAKTLQVQEIECYEHGDAIRTVFPLI